MNTTTHDEFAEMRSQLALLNAKVEREAMITHRMMHQAMRTKMTSLKKTYIWVIAIVLFALPYCCWIFSRVGLSAGFLAFTIAFLLIALVYTLYIYRDLRDPQLTTRNLVEAARRIDHGRRLEHHWLKFSIPAIIVFFAWFIADAYSITHSFNPLCIGGCIGGVAGLVGGIAQRRKTMRTYHDVLAEIEELQAD